jgi:hypothetical protein
MLFDVLVEGLSVSLSRDDKTPLELFSREVACWPTEIAGLLVAS